MLSRSAEAFYATLHSWKKNYPHVITAKKKKKCYDKQGNLITDETLLQDIASGKTVISYSEEKIEDKRRK